MTNMIITKTIKIMFMNSTINFIIDNITFINMAIATFINIIINTIIINMIITKIANTIILTIDVVQRRSTSPHIAHCRGAVPRRISSRTNVAPHRSPPLRVPHRP